MKFLLGSMPHNRHIQNVALSLHEAGWLGLFFTSGADHFQDPTGRLLRAAAGQAGFSKKMSRRRIETVPKDMVRSVWLWEAARLTAARLAGPVAEDWLWEKGERSFDRRCAALMRSAEYDAFFGVEFGCIRTLEVCRAANKPSVAAFVSPHHSFRSRWVDAEYAKFPELMTPQRKTFLRRRAARDALLDAEAGLAGFIHTNSALTTRSLVEAGFPAAKMIEAPLGSPPAAQTPSTPPPGPVRFLCAGLVSVHKGAHYLLEAWDRAGGVRGAELHFYGRCDLPERYLRRFASKVVFHGSVSPSEIVEAYRSASFLVFPTLCDGAGMVVMEAMAQGLPVITTPNAGAHEFVREGENGFLVPPADAAALADVLARCASEGNSRPDRRRAAWETARNWTWGHYRRTLRAKLEKALEIK